MKLKVFKLIPVFGLCIGLFASPIHTDAVQAKEKDTRLLSLKTTRTNVLFKRDAFVVSYSLLGINQHQTADKYTEAVYLGQGPQGDAKIELNGEILYTDMDNLAFSAQEQEALRQEKANEEEEARKAAEEAEEQARLEWEREQALAAAEAMEEKGAAYIWNGPVLTKSAGTIQGPSGKETYYNLNMNGVVNIMRNMGNTDEYWVRSDGVKMLGDYVMVAANLSVRPRGSLVPTSLGMGIVCDTGGFAVNNPTQLDIAVSW